MAKQPSGSLVAGAGLTTMTLPPRAAEARQPIGRRERRPPTMRGRTKTARDTHSTRGALHGVRSQPSLLPIFLRVIQLVPATVEAMLRARQAA